MMNKFVVKHEPFDESARACGIPGEILWRKNPYLPGLQAGNERIMTAHGHFRNNCAFMYSWRYVVGKSLSRSQRRNHQGKPTFRVFPSLDSFMGDFKCECDLFNKYKHLSASLSSNTAHREPKQEMTFGFSSTLRRPSDEPELWTIDLFESISFRASPSRQNGGRINRKGRRAAEISRKSRWNR